MINMKNNSTKCPDYCVILGTDKHSEQYGIIADNGENKIALDLNHPNTISLFGVQGGGKSYTLGAISEMALMKIPGINYLEQPLASVIFHYSPTQDYSPEFCSMVNPNIDVDQIKKLQSAYGANPDCLNDVVMLTSEDKVNERKNEYPGIEVIPLKFSSKILHAIHWKFLMGAVGNNSVYLRQLTQIMRNYRDKLTIEILRDEIDNSEMPDKTIELAQKRLDFAEQYIDDESNLDSLLKPGRLIIVDIRDELIEKDEALGLFVVLLNLFSETKLLNQDFNKVIIFDECHKYIDNPSLVTGLVEAVREMRHRATSVIIASQDPLSVPLALIELSSILFLHKFNSPNWLKHIKQANTALKDLTPEMMNTLSAGEAYVWASKSSEINYTRQPYKIKCRPRVTKHGGDSLVATRR